MRVVSFFSENLEKYVVYDCEHGVKLYYSYDIRPKEQITILVRYGEGNRPVKAILSCILPFDKNDPANSIKKFNKLLILME